MSSPPGLLEAEREGSGSGCAAATQRIPPSPAPAEQSPEPGARPGAERGPGIGRKRAGKGSLRTKGNSSGQPGSVRRRLKGFGLEGKVPLPLHFPSCSPPASPPSFQNSGLGGSQLERRGEGDGSRPPLAPSPPCPRRPHGVLGAPNGILRAPNGILGTPHGVLRAPNDILGAPHGILRALNGILGAPHGVLGAPHGVLRALWRREQPAEWGHRGNTAGTAGPPSQGQGAC